MKPFSYARPAEVTEAIAQGLSSGAKFLAGGTNLVDLMKENVDLNVSSISTDCPSIGSRRPQLAGFASVR